MKPSRTLFASILLIAAIAIQAVLVPAYVSAQTPVPLAPIDLMVDADADGLPDELVAAVEQIQTNAISNNPAVADAAALNAAIAQLYERLPYSPGTRNLQAKLAGERRYGQQESDPYSPKHFSSAPSPR